MIRLRTNYRVGEKSTLYRTTATADSARTIFLDYLRSANLLHAQPAFYNAGNQQLHHQYPDPYQGGGRRQDRPVELAPAAERQGRRLCLARMVAFVGDVPFPALEGTGAWSTMPPGRPIVLPTSRPASGRAGSGSRL